jgi:predicted nucleic acid-binding protein
VGAVSLASHDGSAGALVDTNVWIDCIDARSRWHDWQGVKKPMPDFYIGAHAAMSNFSVLTRDPGPYRSYFPRLRLIAP